MATLGPAFLPRTFAVPYHCHSINGPCSVIHSFIHHWRCIIVAIVGVVKWNANLDVREWVHAGTSVVTGYKVASVRDLSLAVWLVLRNKVHYVNENDLVSVRLWFYNIADTFVKMKQVSTGPPPWCNVQIVWSLYRYSCFMLTDIYEIWCEQYVDVVHLTFLHFSCTSLRRYAYCWAATIQLSLNV
jgi:hypothetical protein